MLTDVRSARLGRAGLNMYRPRRQVVELAEQLTLTQRSTLLLAGATEALYLYGSDALAEYFALPPLLELTPDDARSDAWLLAQGLIEPASPTQVALTPLGRELVCLLLGDYVACALGALGEGVHADDK